MTAPGNGPVDRPGEGCGSVDCGPEPVIACSLDGADQVERLERWHALLADTRLTRGPLSATVEVPSERAADAVALIRAEQACCPFLTFRLDFHGAVMALTIGAPRPEAEPFVDALLPPETVSRL
jgi:hypothetical protein